MPDRVFDIVDCETPAIAKVRGPAYGMGVNIVLACDFVIAADDARFCDSHVKNGITAGDGGVAFFPLMIRFRKAKEMLMLGDPISGAEAADIAERHVAVGGRFAWHAKQPFADDVALHLVGAPGDGDAPRTEPRPPGNTGTRLRGVLGPDDAVGGGDRDPDLAPAQGVEGE